MVIELLSLALLVGIPTVLVCAARRTLARASDVRIVTAEVVCPVKERLAMVDFVVEAADGDVYEDVAACSLVAPGELAECGKVCRSTSVARFAVSPPSGGEAASR